MLAVDTDEVAESLRLLVEPGQTYEIRAIARTNYGRGEEILSGYFRGDAAAAVSKSDSRDVISWYCTLNPVDAALLARRANRIGKVGKDSTTKDQHVTRRTRLLIDIDPVRPSGISSSEDEHAESLVLAWQIAAELAAEGWPDPMFADSGNGAHLIYAIDLPVDDGGLVERVLAAAAARWNAGPIKVDTGNFNPARITKLYGTPARKGDSVPERPHRLSRLICVPERLVPVTREQLETLAVPAARPETRTAHSPITRQRSTIDIGEWLGSHGYTVRSSSPYSGKNEHGTCYELETCPVDPDHSRGEAVVIQFASGGISASCRHESCRFNWDWLKAQWPSDTRDRPRINGTNSTPRAPDDIDDSHAALYGESHERRDAEPEPVIREAKPDKPRRPGRKATTLAAAIRERANEPWISLRIGGVEIARLRLGAVATMTGAPGAGKSTLAAAFVVEHVRALGPAVYVSIELDADELAARIVGMQSDTSWEDSLRGRVSDADMARALDLPRFSVLEGDDATLTALEIEVEALRDEYPDEPILVVVDYIQIVDSEEKDTRARVAAVAQRLRRIAKRLRIVMLGISQPSRAAGKQLGAGELLGLDTMTAMAESAEIERAAYMTFALGSHGSLRDDGTCVVDLSTGKGRMGGGDRVWSLSLDPKSGRLRVVGDARPAAEVKSERAAKRNTDKVEQVAHVVAGTLAKSAEPMSVAALKKSIGGDGNIVTAAAKLCRDDGRAVRVRGKKSGGHWPVWTRDQAEKHGIDIVPEGVD